MVANKRIRCPLHIQDQPNQPQGKPERTEDRKCAIAKVVAAPEFLKTGYQLGASAQNDCRAEHNPCSAPAKIMKLQ